MNLQDHIDLLKSAESQGIGSVVDARRNALNPIDAEVYSALEPGDVTALRESLERIAQGREASSFATAQCNDTYC